MTDFKEGLIFECVANRETINVRICREMLAYKSMRSTDDVKGSNTYIHVRMIC